VIAVGKSTQASDDDEFGMGPKELLLWERNLRQVGFLRKYT